MPTNPDRASAALQVALGVIDDAWGELQRSPYVQLRAGIVPDMLIDLSAEAIDRHAAVGRALCARIERLDLALLPHDVALMVRLVRFRARVWSHEDEWYWRMIDPCGTLSFGMFLPTAYCGGHLLNIIHNQLGAFIFQGSQDADRYLALAEDYARLVHQFAARTAGQAARGMRIPRAQIPQVRTLMGRLRCGARAALTVVSERLSSLESGRFLSQLEQCVVRRVEPAFDQVLAQLTDDYAARAPESIGIGQYEGGTRLYEELVRVHTTLDITPERVHAMGLERMARIEDSMRAIRCELNFPADDDAALRTSLESDPQWRTQTIEGLTAFFQHYMDRLKPRLPQHFERLPLASYGVSPLPETLEKSMTFGTYDPPRANRPEGRYLFNTANLTQQTLFQIPAILYHELMPGHHLQLGLQQENSLLHPFGMHSLVTAYVEGWAEYAASILATEMELYARPEERYGRLIFDAFLTSRLVLDTGMNVLGWSLARATEYMRAHTALTEAEIGSELMRYACDRPGQALAYKLGDMQILLLRERMQKALGTRFNNKHFHRIVLDPGAVPLPDLAWHVDCEIDRTRERL